MDRRVRKAVELLEREWRRTVRVSELAEQVGLGASRLEHLFKTEAKVSIRDYVRERRLAEAASMLESTEERVSIISYTVGFQDVSNFNHAFKRRYGVTPREFREQAQQGGVSSFDQQKAEDTS
jgi:transcriptional regulator GlxA family with amidase domain